ncbi:hypothetical protein BT63DRAFT_423885 [Microthyrium microscopicum]|uniref:Uncharacterized protein n=1 Tax=Microthyrium microscopicum TaxID=703497 RepID=A0A6A6UFN8_9PEZI|nr:hypothetical protein BT63DRAFT_423885 [Microthyrium microscopicum]
MGNCLRLPIRPSDNEDIKSTNAEINESDITNTSRIELDESETAAIERWSQAVDLALEKKPFDKLYRELKIFSQDVPNIPSPLLWYLQMIVAARYALTRQFTTSNRLARNTVAEWSWYQQDHPDARSHIDWALMVIASMDEIEGKALGDFDRTEGFFLPDTFSLHVESRDRFKRIDITEQFLEENLRLAAESLAYLRQGHYQSSGGTWLNPPSYQAYWGPDGKKGLRVMRRAPKTDPVAIPEPTDQASSIVPVSASRTVPVISESRCRELAALRVQPVPKQLYRPGDLTELHIAASKGDVWKTARLLGGLPTTEGQRTYTIDVEDGEGTNALQYAAWYGQTGTVQLLVEAGASFLARSDRYPGATARSWAYTKGFKNIEAYLKRKEDELEALQAA